MSTTIQSVLDTELPLLRVREATLHWKLIAQLCLCIVPALTSLSVGEPMLGARYLVGALMVVLGYHFLKGNRFEYLALAIGALPALSFLREIFFYYSIIATLGGGLLLWAAVAVEETKFIWRDLTWRWLALLSLLYWWLSILYTGDYFSNMRLLEYLLSATAIYLLASRRSWLATALVGLAICNTFLAVNLLPYGDRLGAADIDGTQLGNPILMGVPSAMILLLALSDRGRWLLLEHFPYGRAILALIAAEWLILSGSRGSWLVATGGMVVLLFVGKLNRKALLGFVALACLVSALVLLSDRGAKIATLFHKTMDPDRTLANRTSFRSVQWAAMPKVFLESPIWGWGPGSGRNVAFLFTGRHLAWHALYLQITGETGLLGLVCLFWILGSLLRRGVVHLRRWGEVTPLLGVLAYMMVGLSVSGFDSVSGIFLGLAFMARERVPRVALREGLVREEQPEEITSSSIP